MAAAPVESCVVTTLPAAVLWDMDGTIVNTEPYWMKAETDLIESFGGTWTHEDALTLVGQDMRHSARVMQAHGVDLTQEQVIAHLTRTVQAQIEGEIPWRPGARELLTALRAASIRTALVTMSIRPLAEHVVASMGFDAFDVVVTGDDVAHGKPHPEAYLRAGDLLGVDVAHCIAIEDSAPGVASAVASGAVTIGVPLFSPLFADRGYELWPTLEGRGVADLTELFGRARDRADGSGTTATETKDPA